ncbi:NAD-dependent epimerase/dehydratase family protein [Heyndrickxia vini]|uniref:NAD-dependent epimerase/dehydratase family protein n=1 Tax=Heyndrickxia vini TaxID=1476025 RepID=A0ABX7E4F8_9BACI|nr:NAD-dependent epimerase/dehydratase family protein [Heyndrickxia vini]QQZ10352.1 NAD-dependent epimerase/dehydratase family protein [Heyndrickxia vini]
MGNILVTGGAGFIGSHLVKELLNLGENVIVVDNLSMGSKENLDLNNKNLTFIEGDISNQSTITELFNTYTFKKIFHLGAVASVAASVEHPLETHLTNLEGTIYLLEAARKQKDIERFVFASSAAVYGDDPALPKRENSPIKPLTPYAIDKYASERYVINYSKLYGLPTVALRFFNVYGIGQNPSSPYSGVVSIITDRLKKKLNGEDASFILFGDGSQTRDFVFVKDVVQANLLVSNNKDAIGNVYNVGTGEKISLMDLISTYIKISGIDLPIKKEAVRSGDIKDSYADVSALKSIGFMPEFTVEEGLKVYWEHQIK